MKRAATRSGILDESVLRNFAIGRRYLVAVSGGRDSVALLHALVGYGYTKLVVCHLNHQLRARSAAADERLVRRLADKHGLPFEVRSSDVRLRATTEKHSIETAARAARFEFFSEIARRQRCKTIFLGHHADDLVETFLMHLFRGSAGARSIQPVATHSLGKTKLTIVRPMLHAWRRAIDAYIAEHRLNFREDATNAKLDATRNRMRHTIIPFLEKESGREIRKTIWRTAIIAAEEDGLLEGMLADKVSEKLNVRSLAAQPLALQRRLLRNWLRAHKVADIGFDLIENVRSLLEPAIGPAKVNLPRSRHARRRAGELFVE